LIHYLTVQFRQFQREYQPWWDDLQCLYATEEEIRNHATESRIAHAGIGFNNRRVDGVFVFGKPDKIEGFPIEVERSGKPRASYRRMIDLIKAFSQYEYLDNHIEATGFIIASDNEKYLRAIYRRLEKDDHPAKHCVIYLYGGPLVWQTWPENGKTIADVGDFGFMAENNLIYDNRDFEDDEFEDGEDEDELIE